MRRKRAGVLKSALLRKAIADVTRRKGRTILVVLGIMISVFGLTTINLANDALASAFARTQSQASAPDIVISVNGVDPSLAADLEAVANVKTVQIDSVYNTRWLIKATPGHAIIKIVGYQNFQTVKINQFHLIDGRLSGPGEIIMEAGSKGLQSFSTGGTLLLETPHGPVQLRISGQSRTPGLPSAAITGTAQAYMRADVLDQLTGMSQANDIEVQVQNAQQRNQTAKALVAVLQQHQVSVLGTNVIDHSSDLGATAVNALLSIMRVLSLIALLLTSFLILNTITTLIAEQTRIIGTMKALGGTSGTVIRGYLLTVGIYSLSGTLLGIVLGIWGADQLTATVSDLMVLERGPFQLSPVILLISVLIGLGIPFLAAYLPLWQGTHVTVHEAMSGYGTSAGGSRGALAPRLTWVPQTLWLSLRTIFRKRGRAIRTLLALTLSATAFLSIQTTTYAFNTGVDQLTSAYNFDASVGINPQPYEKVRTQLLNLPNVATVERWQSQLMQTPKGNVVLTGFESNTQLYIHHMLTGRWLNNTDEHALVITDILAQRAHLKVGDTLNITSAVATTTWHVIGTLHDINDSSGGLLGEAITTIDQFNSFTGFPNQLGYQLIVGAHDRSPDAVDRLANQIDKTLSLAGMAPAVTTIQQMVNQSRSQFQLIDVLFYVVAAIIALVGILGLFNTLTSSILERRREIGVLRAIGATRWRISTIAWFEGSVLSLLAWVVAALLGIPCAYGFVQLVGAVLLPIPFAFSPVAMIMMLIFVMILATLASIGPAMGAVRMRIAETLRYE